MVALGRGGQLHLVTEQDQVACAARGACQRKWEDVVRNVMYRHAQFGLTPQPRHTDSAILAPTMPVCAAHKRAVSRYVEYGSHCPRAGAH